MEKENNESNERVKEFLEKYGKLVEEMGVDFANYPMFVPGPNGRFEVIIQSTPIDIKGDGVKSPFIEDVQEN